MLLRIALSAVLWSTATASGFESRRFPLEKLHGWLGIRVAYGEGHANLYHFDSRSDERHIGKEPHYSGPIYLTSADGEKVLIGSTETVHTADNQIGANGRSAFVQVLGDYAISVSENGLKFELLARPTQYELQGMTYVAGTGDVEDMHVVTTVWVIPKMVGGAVVAAPEDTGVSVTAYMPLSYRTSRDVIPQPVMDELISELQGLGLEVSTGGPLRLRNRGSYYVGCTDLDLTLLPDIKYSIHASHSLDSETVFEIVLSPEDYLGHSFKGRCEILVHSTERPDHVTLGMLGLSKASVHFDFPNSRIGFAHPK